MISDASNEFRTEALKEFNKCIDKYEEVIAKFNNHLSDLPEDVKSDFMIVIKERNKLAEKWRNVLIMSIDFQNMCISEINRLFSEFNIKDSRKRIVTDTSKFKTINNDIRLSEKK